MSIYEKAADAIAGAAMEYSRLACDMVGFPVPRDASPGRAMALLLARLAFGGSRQIADPVTRASRKAESFDMAEEAIERGMATAEAYLPFWRGASYASIAGAVYGLLAMGEPEELDAVTPFCDTPFGAVEGEDSAASYTGVPDTSLFSEVLLRAAAFFQDHAMHACDALEIPLPDGGNDEALARLVAWTLLDRHRTVADPAHKVAAAVQEAEKAGAPFTPEEQEMMAEAALAYMPAWRGEDRKPMSNLLPNMAMYCDPARFDGLHTILETTSGWDAYFADLEGGSGYYDDLRAEISSKYELAVSAAREACGEATAKALADFESARAAAAPGLGDPDPDVRAAAEAALSGAEAARDAETAAADAAWRAVNGPAEAVRDRALASVDAARKQHAEDAKKAALEDYGRRHGTAFLP